MNVKNALVVEDDPATAELIAAALAGRNIRATVAINGREGLARLRENIPDLVTLDLSLPDMDGLELLEKIRERPEHRKIPVLVISMLDHSGYRNRAESLGTRAYFTKPFSVAQLLGAVEQIAGEGPGARS